MRQIGNVNAFNNVMAISLPNTALTHACILMPPIIKVELVGGAGATNHPINASLACQQKRHANSMGMQC